MSETVYYKISGNKEPLSEKQLELLEEAKRTPIVFDEDCPELTPAMEKAFRCSAAYRNRQKTKQTS